jgi:glycosyltransferase involved in cell wall biosynthesis
MNILFLSYWGIEEGLTASTVIPHLAILNEVDAVDRIFFYSIERVPRRVDVKLPEKVWHMPLTSSSRYISKISDFIRFPLTIRKTIETHQIRLMFCRGAPAGALGYLVHRLTGIEYIVESFEPHARYMIESRVWHAWGLRFNFQRYWESMQIKTARYLLPVSYAMKEHLLRQGVPNDKIFVMPCAVNTDDFIFNGERRTSIRHALDIPQDCIAGIYVGKFGGLYYDKEAFEIFKQALNFFKNFKIIILSPNDTTEIEGKLRGVGVPDGRFHVLNVDHREVPAFLSAADLAFGFFKPSPSIKFSSAIKIGEYWAVGLPVLIPTGIGDDSMIVQQEKAGAVFDLSNLAEAFVTMRDLLRQDKSLLRDRIRNLAFQYRNFSTNSHIYKTIFTEMFKR